MPNWWKDCPKSRHSGFIRIRVLIGLNYSAKWSNLYFLSGSLLTWAANLRASKPIKWYSPERLTDCGDWLGKLPPSDWVVKRASWGLCSWGQLKMGINLRIPDWRARDLENVYRFSPTFWFILPTYKERQTLSQSNSPFLLLCSQWTRTTFNAPYQPTSRTIPNVKGAIKLKYRLGDLVQGEEGSQRSGEHKFWQRHILRKFTVIASHS